MASEHLQTITQFYRLGKDDKLEIQCHFLKNKTETVNSWPDAVQDQKKA